MHWPHSAVCAGSLIIFLGHLLTDRLFLVLWDFSVLPINFTADILVRVNEYFSFYTWVFIRDILINELVWKSSSSWFRTNILKCHFERNEKAPTFCIFPLHLVCNSLSFMACNLISDTQREESQLLSCFMLPAIFLFLVLWITQYDIFENADKFFFFLYWNIRYTANLTKLFE